ncbi:MAG: peptidylprolyl isomerase [Candidatus Firestonebacteria bacterium]
MKKLSVIIGVLFAAAVMRGAPEVIDRVLVSVNGEMITLSEFNEIFVPYAMQAANSVPAEEMKKAKKEIFSKLLENKLLIQEAVDKNIEVGKRELENTIDNAKKNAGGSEAFLAQLKKEGLSEEDFKEKVKESLMAQRLVNDYVRREIKISVQDYQDYYQKNIEKFRYPDKVKLYHILIKNGPEAKTKAESIVKEIKAGLAFPEAVKKYSDAPSAKEDGGELGLVSPGEMPAFGLEPFSLKDGEISMPVQTSMGFHILKVTERSAGKQLVLSDEIEENGRKISVREIAQQRVLEERFKEKYNQYIEKLKAKAVISIKIEEFK